MYIFLSIFQVLIMINLKLMLVFVVLAAINISVESASHIWTREDVMEAILMKHLENKFPKIYNILYKNAPTNKRFLVNF